MNKKADYQSIVAANKAIRQLANSIFQADKTAMENRIQKLIADEKKKATLARVAQFAAVAAAAAGGPALSAVAAVALTAAVAKTQSGVDNAESRAAALRIEAATETGEVNKLLAQLNAKVVEYGKGKKTFQNFVDKAAEWSKISAQVDGLKAEMDEHATKAAWTSMGGSSSLYEQRVPAQKAALAEMSQVAENNSKVSIGIATLQVAIYGATLASMEAVAKTAVREANAAVVDANNNLFFRGTMTLRASLSRLLLWMNFQSPIAWFFSSATLQGDLTRTLSSVEVLAGGWPGRNEDAPAGAQAGTPADGSAVEQVDQRDFSLGETTGQTGGVLRW